MISNPSHPESSASLEHLDRQVMWHPFTQMSEWEPLVIAAAEGMIGAAEIDTYRAEVAAEYCG